MKRLLMIFIILGLTLSVYADNYFNKMMIKERPQKMERKVLKSEIHKQAPAKMQKASEEFPGGLIYFEDFEPGGVWHRWTSGQIIPQPDPSYWHLTTWNALEDSSWWLANEDYGTYGGYANHWYQVLETPLFLMNDTAATFSFYHRFNIEGPAGAEDPYDGWDGINVRISVDSGATWQVLPFSTYNVSSSWAFGHPSQGFDEGPGVPAWAGTLNNWRKETIDLSEYCSADTAVMLRFAFASDMGYSTTDGGPDLWGWEIDSIEVYSPDTMFFANYGTTDDMVGKSIVFVPPPGGDLWHVAELDPTYSGDIPAYNDNPDFLPSGTHIATVQRGQDYFYIDSTYNKWMQNYYTTGPISLPDTTPIYIDLKQIPYFADDDYGDWWQVQVRPVDSTDFEGAWREWVQNSTTGEWYWAHWVYNNVAGLESWTDFSYYWGSLANTSPLDISRFAGQDVYLRIFFNSDGDDPLGPGLMIDDLAVFAPINPPALPDTFYVTPNGEDTTVTINFEPEDGVTYEIWRTTPGDQYIHWVGTLSNGESSWTDTSAVPFQIYYYGLRATVRYEGSSDWSMFQGTIVIPSILKEVGFDDAQRDSFFVPGGNYKLRHKVTAVKFTPKYYPVSFEAFKVYLDTTLINGRDPQGKGYFYIYNADPETGWPDSVLQEKQFSAGLTTGVNLIVLDSAVTINEGSFFIGWERQRYSPYISVDTSDPIDGNTYWNDTDTTWAQLTDMDAMIHVYMDTSSYPVVNIEDVQSIVADRFMLLQNYPNPFNPTTIVPFVVPANRTNAKVKVDVFNILGQKVITLFDGKAKPGLHKLEWNGKNELGKKVGSGIYLVRMKSGKTELYKRMLLIK